MPISANRLPKCRFSRNLQPILESNRCGLHLPIAAVPIKKLNVGYACRGLPVEAVNPC